MKLDQFTDWLITPFFGVAVWVWVALPMALILSFAVAYFIVHGAMWFMEKAFEKARKKELFQRTIKPLLSPLIWVVASILFNVVDNFLPIDEKHMHFLDRVEILFHSFAVSWTMVQYLHLLIDGYRRRLLAQERVAAASMMPLVKKGANALVAVLAILFILQNFGYDVTAMLTAAGVGGIAVALAGQKSLEGIFGGLSIALDQPVRVGDFGNFDNKVMGTVEDIGLHACRIRTLGQTVVTIPNTMMNNMIIENFSLRQKFWFKHVVGLRYDTSPDTMRRIIGEFKTMLLKNEHVIDKDARARFLAFNASSLDIELFAFVNAPDYSAFLEIQEELLLSIMDIVKQAGADFAFPTQTLAVDSLPEKLVSSLQKPPEHQQEHPQSEVRRLNKAK